jgi:hypothetical protein
MLRIFAPKRPDLLVVLVLSNSKNAQNLDLKVFAVMKTLFPNVSEVECPAVDKRFNDTKTKLEMERAFNELLDSKEKGCK